MSTKLLKEYRCDCNKLLFKGLLFLGVVEIKCRRCGLITSAEKFKPHAFAVLESDPLLSITAAVGDTKSVFKCEQKYLLGKKLNEFLPLVRDGGQKQSSHAKSKSYAINSNTSVLKDDGSSSLKSYMVPKQEKGSISGYRTISWIESS